MTLNLGGAKFEVTRFEVTKNFGIFWQKRIKDLLAQQGLQKVFRDEKSTDIATVDWNEMKEKVTGLLTLCISNDMMNHILDLTASENV